MKSLDGVGILWLVCDACGDRVQAIARTPAELRKMRKQFKVARPSTAKRPPATVTSIRTSKKRSQAS
jgi:ribosomal protein L34E